MKARRVWVCLGGGLCMTAAMFAQRVWGQTLPPGIPGVPAAPTSTLPLPPAPPQAPSISVPSKQLDGGVIPVAPPITQSIQPPPSLTAPPAGQPTALPSVPTIPVPTSQVPTSQVPTIPVTSVPVSSTPVPVIPVTPVSPVTPIPVVPGPAVPDVPTIPAVAPPTSITTTSTPPTEIPGLNSSTSSYRSPELTGGETRPGKQEPAVSVEWLGGANARFNQPANYQILVKNNGGATVTNVMVKPTLPNDVVIKSSDPFLPQGQDAAWNVGSLAPGQVRKIDVVIQSQKRGYQNYTATVTFAATTTHLTEVREPLLAVKMKAPEKILVGEPAPILFTISNPGDGTTENIKVRAMLPDGLDHPRGNAFEINAGNLAPKETRTLQLACVAKGHGQMKATLIASADGSLNASDVASFEVLLPKLDLVLNGPKLRFVERPARYTMKITNPGTAPAQNVVLNEVVPAGFKFQAASNAGKYDEITRTVSWQVGDLPPGQTREISVDLIPTVPGDHRLAAAVVSARGVRNESSLQTRVEGLSNLILEVANADNPVEVNADATYEIRIANAGTKAETNVELVCSLPDSVDFRDAKSASGARFRMENRDVVFEALPRLTPRGEVIYRVTVKGRLPGDVRFRARLRADGMADAIIREETTKFYDDNAVR